jgi:hypothetical protein
LWVSAAGRGNADRHLRQRARRDADVGKADRSTKRPSGLEQMAGLQPEEGYGRRGLDRDAANLAGLAVEPRGNIDGDHRAPIASEGVDPFDKRPRLALDVAGEPGAEESVDHATRAVEGEIGRGPDLPVEARGGDRGVAAERLAPPEEAEFDRKAPLRQESRRDEAIAAVIAGTAEHDDASAGPPQARRLVRHSKPRPLHQYDAGDARGDSKPVGLGHLARRKQFGEFPRVQHPPMVAPTSHAHKRQERPSHRGEFCYIAVRLIPDSSAGRAFDC